MNYFWWRASARTFQRMVTLRCSMVVTQFPNRRAMRIDTSRRLYGL
jgi:hypothetical protein